MSEFAQSVAERNLPSISGKELGSLTVADLVDRYMRAYAGRDMTRGQRLSWWVGKLGSKVAASLTEDDVFYAIQELENGPGRHYVGRDADGRPILKDRKRRLSPATLNRYQAALQALLTWGLKKRLLPRGFANPCARLDKAAENNERVRFLSAEERTRLLAACSGSKWSRLYSLVLLALTTGGRRTELTRLRWGDVDLEASTASVLQTKNNDRKIFPLTANVVAALRALGPGQPEVLIFASLRRPGQAYNFEPAWQAALRTAKVKDFRFHDLRHSCASYLAQSGSTLLEIADVLGHRQLSVTRRYSHLTVQHKARLVNRVLGDLK